MIRVDQALCVGCGACVDECPARAITLVDGTAMVDAALCDGCGSFDERHDRLCVQICPNGALAWVAEPVPQAVSERSSLAVYQPPVEVVNVDTRQPVPWRRTGFGELRRTDFGELRRTVLPAVGSALSWVGREVIPRLAPLVLDVLDSAVDRRLSPQPRDEGVLPVSTKEQSRRRRGRRRRHRRGSR